VFKTSVFRWGQTVPHWSKSFVLAILIAVPVAVTFALGPPQAGREATRLLGAWLWQTTAAVRDNRGGEAERFVGRLLQQATAVLRDNSGGEAACRERLHRLVMENLDARGAALFALGPYQRQLDLETMEAYVAAFTDYITAVYETRLRTFRAHQFKVVASTDAGRGDTTVVTQAVPPLEQRGRGGPVHISLRISPASGQYKIVDVQIAGIWVSMYQREQFAKWLSENRGDLSALTHDLNYRAAQIKAGKAEV
jgi:ABC-type transporter MlaC component